MFPNLIAEMARTGVMKKDIVKLLGLTKKTVTGRFSGRYGFTLEEGKMIRDKFFPKLTLDYLFETDSESTPKQVISEKAG